MNDDPSMNSRADILGRLRRRLGRTADNAVRGRAAIETQLAALPAARQSNAAGDPSARFRDQALALASSVDEVARLADVPAAVADYLTRHALPRQAVGWPAYAHLAWAAHGIDLATRPACGDDAVGLTGCFAAVAETGTLMLCSGAETPAATSLLPETHIAVLPVSRIVADMAAAWGMLRRELGELPRAVNFISGPSRTGDIEQTIVLGAHGPRRVHVILLREE